MKKTLFICASLFIFNSHADDTEVVTKESSVSLSASASPMGLGGSVDWSVKREDEEQESTSTSTIEVKPVDVTSGGLASDGTRFHIDIMGDSQKRRFLTEKDKTLVPYFQQQFSGLEYTYDGQDSSWRMLNGGIGVGLKLNISDDVDLSAHAGVGLGVELGKRRGFFDTSVYSQAELDLFDRINIVAKEEMRASFDGDREVIGSLSTSVRINDDIRAGLEFERTQNTFSGMPESNYNTNYGGIFISGRFGGSR